MAKPVDGSVGGDALRDHRLEPEPEPVAVHHRLVVDDGPLIARAAGEGVAAVRVGVEHVDCELEALLGVLLRRRPTVRAEIEARRQQVGFGVPAHGGEARQPQVHQRDPELSVLDGCHVAFDRRELAPDVEACAALEPETAERLGSLARRELALERVKLAP